MVEDFTVRLRELDNDQLIQTEEAVKECLDYLYSGQEPYHVIVRLEANAAAEAVEREFLRRAKFGTHVPRKTSATT